MILLIGALADNVIAYLVGKLVDRGVSFLLLDPRRQGVRYDLSWSIKDGEIDGCLRYEDKVLSLAEVRSAYVHSLHAPQPAGWEAGRRA